MRMEIKTDPMTGDILFSGRVSMDAVAMMNLDAFDLSLIRDCDPSKGDTTAADWLLALETMFRKAAPFPEVK